MGSDHFKCPVRVSRPRCFMGKDLYESKFRRTHIQRDRQRERGRELDREGEREGER